MAMSGIKVSKDCEEAHDRQQKKKQVQWTVYCIANFPESGKAQVKGGERPAINPDGCQHDREFSANQANDMLANGSSDAEIETNCKELFMKFVEELPDNECRYAVFDFVQKTKSGAYNDKMKLVSWSPDCSSVKQKMIYASTKETLIKKLSLPPKEVHLTSKASDDVQTAFQALITE